MQVTINVKMYNDQFDQEFANQHYNGEESEDNIKYLWEDEFMVKGKVKEFKVLNNAVYTLAGIMPDGTSFSYEIQAMTICECQLEDDTITRFAFSKKLIKSTFKSQEQENIIFSVILRKEKETVNPMDGVYIQTGDFPKELL